MPVKIFEKFYNESFRKYGPTEKGVRWGNKKNAVLRYKNLSKIFDYLNLKRKKYDILDVGCGYGRMLDFIDKRKIKKYTGIDLSQSMVDYCNKKKNKKNYFFFKKDLNIYKKKHDVCIVNGIFTTKATLTNKEMEDFFLKSINRLFKISRFGFCFNLMSQNVDYKSKILFYPNIDFVYSTINKLSNKKFIIDNSYGLFEYSVFIKK